MSTVLMFKCQYIKVYFTFFIQPFDYIKLFYSRVVSRYFNAITIRTKITFLLKYCFGFVQIKANAINPFFFKCCTIVRVRLHSMIHILIENIYISMTKKHTSKHLPLLKKCIVSIDTNADNVQTERLERRTRLVGNYVTMTRVTVTCLTNWRT